MVSINSLCHDYSYYSFPYFVNMATASRIQGSGVTTIFFDLDNTLIFTKQGDKKACDKVLQNFLKIFLVPWLRLNNLQ